MSVRHGLIHAPARLVVPKPSVRSTKTQCVREVVLQAALPVITIHRQHHYEYSTAPTSSSFASSGSGPAKEHPLRLAVVGSGPAGFYSTRRILQRLEGRIGGVAIDMYEQLPVPFGLVRFGVAPDHPEVKNCIDTFTEVAASPAFRFRGNVRVGTDVSLAALREAYDSVLLAYGAAADRTLGIPGEKEFERVGAGGGVYSARAFVGWYNGLPEYANLNPALDFGDTAVVIGQGNVALDVARVLLSDIDRLRHTDISEQALATLVTNRVRHVHVVGRRGPMQAAFTIKELRELMTLRGVNFSPIQPGLLPDNLKSLPRAKKRIAELLTRYSKHADSVAVDAPTSTSGLSKVWNLGFLQAPKAFLEDPKRPGHLGSVEFTRTKYCSDDPIDMHNANARVESTELSSRLEASLAFRSIGYKSVPLPGMSALGINFDSRRGIVPNIDGRVITSTGEHIEGFYATGWVKNGPTGVIATTMEDAFAAAETIVEDWAAKERNPSAGTVLKGGWEQIQDSVNAKPVVSWDDWLKIDKAEVAAGRMRDKERAKFTSIERMLAVP